MSYQITITETFDTKKTIGKKWGVIGTKETAREPDYCRGANEPKTRIEEVYGYTPETETTVSDSREVLKQTVDKLDLAAVIKAINGL